MMDLLKLARLIETPNHEDSIRDRFGYQGCYVDLVLNKSSGEWQEWPSAVEPVVADDQHLPDDLVGESGKWEEQSYKKWEEQSYNKGGKGGIGGVGFGGYDTAEEWEAVKARLSRNVTP
jgi:hypothetical protein